MKKVLAISVCFLLAFAFLSAKGIGRAEPKTKVWTCSMHPEVKLPKPGKCPTCFMDLVPGEGEEATEEVQNEICPVLGNKINPQFFTEYQGKKVLFCCKMCPSKFKKNPEKYLEKLPQFARSGELEKLRAELRTVLKKIAEQEKVLHGEAAGREMTKLLMEEMKGVSKETGIGMVGCCPMHMEMMEKCLKKGAHSMMKEHKESEGH